MKNFRRSDVLDKALDELRRLATNQHQTVSAVTLNVSERILAHLSDSASCQLEILTTEIILMQA